MQCVRACAISACVFVCVSTKSGSGLISLLPAPPSPNPLPIKLPAQVTSSAKRKLKPGSTHVHQTPDGSFYDLQQNARDMLTAHCGMQVPEVRPAGWVAG